MGEEGDILDGGRAVKKDTAEVKIKDNAGNEYKSFTLGVMTSFSLLFIQVQPNLNNKINK